MFFNLQFKESQVNKIVEELEYVRDLQKVNVEDLQNLIDDIKEECSMQRSALERYCGRKDLQDCNSCGQSMVTEEDELYCVIKKEIVKDDDVCGRFN